MDHASCSLSLSMIRIVMGTPRSARIIVASSSSQSIGLTENVWSSVSKNFIEQFVEVLVPSTCLLASMDGTTTATTAGDIVRGGRSVAQQTHPNRGLGKAGSA